MHKDCEESFCRQISLPDNNVDLLRAALLIGADEYPDLDVAHHVATLDAWAQEIGRRVAPGMDEQIQIRQLNKFLFRELGFSGNTGEYYDPRNSYINEVLERRRGIPISLSVVYMELGRRLGLDLVGVSFPGHFLVKLPYGGGEVVIDPYNGGISLSAEDLTDRLQGVFDVAIESPAPFLAPASNKHILIRMLANLKGIYQQQGKAAKIIPIITKILLVDPDRVSEYRDRGLMFNALECYNAALKDFQYYLHHAPDDEDTGDVRQLVFRLQEHHSRLN